VFSKNSSIKIKEYMLDKNEKKLVKDHISIILTEKEVELLELLSNIKKPITKKNILTLVWHYAADADTHTVETHIYRLRKKIISKFSDDQFILNDTEGYYL
jgi:DNA-binding response OmpR family regulator